MFWQNIPSIHQAALIRNMAYPAGTNKVIVVAAADIPTYRRHMGWDYPDFGSAEMHVKPERSRVDELVAATSSSGFVHIFSGIHAYRLVSEAIGRVAKTDATIGVRAEPGCQFGLRKVVSKARTAIDMVCLGRRIDFVLGNSSLACEWYRAAGFRNDRIFLFGYFIDDTETGTEHLCNVADVSDVPTITYVGRMVHLKGIDLLLSALSRLKNHRWRLVMVGEGDSRDHYHDLANRLLGGERVLWLGSLSNMEARAVIGQSDLLVLPSRDDGWGVVVNEALSQGVPVVCSDHCGAADLLADSDRGSIFRSGCVDSLVEALTPHILRGQLTFNHRMRIRSWSDCISARAAARYLEQILEYVHHGGVRPIAPWMSDR